MATSPQTLELDDRQAVADWAVACVEHVLPIFTDACPGDDRVHETLALTRAFATGELDPAEAIRRRGGAAGAAAREAANAAATAVAYAAEQAAAVAHMGAHGLGAAGYAAKARVLATPDDGTALDTEVRWQVDAMSDRVARALATLPALGEDRRGPLGIGRLVQGDVGAAIRLLQQHLRPDAAAPAGRA